VSLAPRYSFGKPQNGKPRRGNQHRTDIDEIRLWARRFGYGLPLKDQVVLLQAGRYSGMSCSALEQILMNQTWFDPKFDRMEPDAVYFDLPLALLLLHVIAQVNALVSLSPASVAGIPGVGGLDQLGGAERGEGVLDGAAIEAGVRRERLGGADLLLA
jgi:hypothetical protein